MVWGAFGYHGQGNLVVLPRNENLNKTTNLELLCDHLSECSEAYQTDIFYAGWCPTPRVVKQWLQNCHYIEDWPGNSPNLNPFTFHSTID